MGRRDPGAADQVTRLSGCSETRAAGAGSFERFSASFLDKLREKLARPDAAVPLREAGSLPSFSARRLLSRATAAAALRALRRARFFRASAAGSATMGGSGGCSGDMTWATNRAASGGRSSPGVDDAREPRDDRRTGVTSPPGAKSAPMPTAFVGLNCWGVAPRDPAAGVAARRAESARFSARSWRDRASGVVAMGDGASMSAGSSPTVGAAASRRRCAWRLAFFA